MFTRITVIVLDGVGIGAAPDAADYGDEGTNSIANVADTLEGISLPNMGKLGLGNITPIRVFPKQILQRVLMAKCDLCQLEKIRCPDIGR